MAALLATVTRRPIFIPVPRLNIRRPWTKPTIHIATAISVPVSRYSPVFAIELTLQTPLATSSLSRLLFLLLLLPSPTFQLFLTLLLYISPPRPFPLSFTYAQDYLALSRPFKHPTLTRVYSLFPSTTFFSHFQTLPPPPTIFNSFFKPFFKTQN